MTGNELKLCSLSNHIYLWIMHGIHGFNKWACRVNLAAFGPLSRAVRGPGSGEVKNVLFRGCLGSDMHAGVGCFLL